MSLEYDLIAIANSEFTTALVGSLAGAFAGAYAAQKIALRAKLRDEVIRDIRNVNAAISLAAGIASSAFNLKSQHVRPMFAAYVAEKERFKNWSPKLAAGEIKGDARYELKVDLRTAPTLSTPISALSDLVYGYISATGRPLSLCAALTAAVERLNQTVEQRNRMIESFKGGTLPAGSDVVSLYFGLPYGEGHVNEEFGDHLSGMNSYLDDAIFFSTQLCADLTEHGEQILKRHKRAFKAKELNVSRTDFSAQRAAKLVPDDRLYETWFTGFQKRDK